MENTPFPARRHREIAASISAAEAKADLELVRKNIFIQIRYRDENLWGADTFDAYRWLIARSIMKLQDLLK